MHTAKLVSAAAAALGLLVPVPATQVEASTAPSRYLPTVADDAGLTLEAFWEPARTSLYRLFETTPVLQAPEPDEALRAYTAEAFRALLPAEPVHVGSVWKLPDDALVPFLSQFHPGVHTRLHHGNAVRGTYACLRAVNGDAVELLLRTHVQYALEDGVRYIPAQFEGRLVLGREDGRVHAFRLALPSRDTNVDVNVPMEYFRDGRRTKSMSADIGWVPRMELVGGQVEERVWTEALADDEARLLLRKSFYSFAQVDWLPFEEAVRRSRAEKKPLHVVLLFGSLDDESC